MDNLIERIIQEARVVQSSVVAPYAVVDLQWVGVSGGIYQARGIAHCKDGEEMNRLFLVSLAHTRAAKALALLYLGEDEEIYGGVAKKFAGKD
jgi:hypothetical protein